MPWARRPIEPVENRGKPRWVFSAQRHLNAHFLRGEGLVPHSKDSAQPSQGDRTLKSGVVHLWLEERLEEISQAALGSEVIMKFVLGGFTAYAACVLLAACGGEQATPSSGGDSAGQGVEVSVDPTTASLAASQTQAFAAAVTGSANTAVSWSLVEGSEGGVISSSGLYTAPSTAGTYHLLVTSAADSSKTATATITVTVGNPPPPSTADCATAPLRGTGTVHYFCPSGSDSNNGLTASTPKASWSAISSAIGALVSGDTVALCRGGSWSVTSPLTISKRCAADPETCDIRDYGTGALPVIHFSVGSNAAITLNGSSYVRIWNLDLEEASATYTIIAQSDTRNMDVCGNTLNNGSFIIAWEPSGKDNLNTTIRGNTISNGTSGGWYGGGPNVQILGNTFANNGIGAQDGSRHSAYLVAFGPTYYPEAPWDGNPGTLPVVFSNNKVTTSSLCGGVMVVIHGEWKNSTLVLQNNDIVNDGTGNGACEGIQIAAGESGAYFHNFTVDRNRITPGPVAQAIEMNCCLNCSITNNIVNNSIAVGWATNNCTSSATASSDTIENNTIYIPSSPWAWPVYTAGSGHVLASNAIWAKYSSCYSAAGTSVNTTNYCSTGTPAATSLWNSPATGDFTLAADSPLSGAGSTAYSSNVAVGTAAWSVSDSGVTRESPPNEGAF